MGIRRILQKVRRKLVGGSITVDDLVKRGLVLGKNVFITSTAVIDPPHCWLIEIGDDVVVAEGAIILAHDPSAVQNNATRIGRVKIGKKTFIGARSVVLPGVTIGDNVIIGAGSVVTKNIPNNVIAVGNPCKVVGDRVENEKFHKDNLNKLPTYEWPKYGIEGGITEEMKEEMKRDLANSYGYLVNK